MKTSIVIPNWNGVSLLKKHLPAVITACKDNEIIVVDDASNDNSVEFLKQNHPQIKLIEKRSHEGFASTINAGVTKASGDIVVLLNTDVEPEADFLDPLLKHFRDKKVFAVGCMDKSYENGNVVLRGRGIGKWEKGFYVHQRGEVDKTDTDWVAGGSGAFRKSIWKELGGMDEIYNPFYWEDIDLSYRAKQAGYKLVFEPKSIVHHYHELGKIKAEYTENQIKQIAYRNQYIFIWKNVTGSKLIVEHLFWLPIRLVQSSMQGNFLMLVGFVSGLMKLPQILILRVKNRMNIY